MEITPNTTVFNPPTALERTFNRTFGLLVGLGFGLKHNYLLQVRGRKSGKLYSTPIDLLEMDGKRFLVAPRGRTQWVRNAEAAGKVTLKRGRFGRAGVREYCSKLSGVRAGGGRLSSRETLTSVALVEELAFRPASKLLKLIGGFSPGVSDRMLDQSFPRSLQASHQKRPCHSCL